MMAAWSAPLLTLLLTTGTAAFTPSALHLVALPPGADTARVGIHRARLGEALPLFVAIEGTLNGQWVVVSEAPALELAGKRVNDRRLLRPADVASLAQAELRWFKVQAQGKAYDNTVDGFHWEPIEYGEHPWPRAAAPEESPWQRPADASSMPPYTDRGGLGTMAFKVELRLGEQRWASPGKESIFRGGLSDAVTRVAIRRDDTFLGHLTELFNLPYIWGSAGEPAAVHQAERLIGADCADFVVYGARRLGKDLPYRGSWHIPLIAKPIKEAVKVDAEGRYVDARGAPLVIGEGGAQVGDILLFHGHVGALASDREPLGVLDIHDTILHTFWAPPAEEPLADTAYRASPLRVMRLK